jgi:hypothetical protein
MSNEFIVEDLEGGFKRIIREVSVYELMEPALHSFHQKIITFHYDERTGLELPEALRGYFLGICSDSDRTSRDQDVQISRILSLHHFYVMDLNSIISVCGMEGQSVPSAKVVLSNSIEISNVKFKSTSSGNFVRGHEIRMGKLMQHTSGNNEVFLKAPEYQFSMSFDDNVSEEPIRENRSRLLRVCKSDRIPTFTYHPYFVEDQDWKFAEMEATMVVTI